jgi:8-oxo-dGTP pyrophosphatase MutT (NUDIX family)
MYRGRLIELVQQEMSNGQSTQIFEFARRGPGTRIVFFDGQKVLIAREFRYESGTYDMRLPGGKVFDTLKDFEAARTANADMIALATRTIAKEAAEEVGLRPTSLELFHKSVCGATISWDLYYFICRRWEPLLGQQLEDGENITFSWYTAQDVRRMCLSGEVSEDRSAITLLRALQRFGA